MKGLIILSLLCVYATISVAQKQANIWYFGQNAGFDFNAACQPVALDNSGMYTMWSSAVIADGQTGQLLFYTDGYQVFNQHHQPMPNGQFASKFAASGPPSQGALIVPVPASSAQYYVFRLSQNNADDTAPANGLRLNYSVIDLKLDQGRGGILGKDITLSDGLAGKLTAIPHANGQDYWLITHQEQGSAFLIYSLTARGIGQADTLRIGSEYRHSEGGFLKASPNGRKLASTVTTAAASPFDLFDFDPASGRISNYINLGPLRTQYGLSFSPDNSKLYVTNQSVVDTELIRQYDLKAGSPQAIIASAKSIIYQNPLTNIPTYQARDQRIRDGFYAPSLQIGPDGRIYCTADYSNQAGTDACSKCAHHLIVINKPNEPGFSCDVQSQSAELGSGRVGDASDLPNFMQHYFEGLQPQVCPFDGQDACTVANVVVSPNPATSELEVLITDLCYKPYQLRIINEAGQVLASYEVREARSPLININALAAGIYFLDLHFADHTLVKRLVKR